MCRTPKPDAGLLTTPPLAISQDAEEGETDLPVNHKFVPQILQHITPVLLEAMTKQDDDEEE